MEIFNLKKIHKQIWNNLSIGIENSTSAFHYPNVCTINNQGYPSVRTVVLRKIDKINYKLFFNTDIRSQKWKEIQNSSLITVHFYDNKLKTQLRIYGKSKLHYNNNEWNEAWKNTKNMSRECYASPYAPSTFIDEPKIIDDTFSRLKKKQLNKFKVNFGRIEIKIKHIDWLYLRHSGHRRAKFIYEENKTTMKWLAP